MKTFEKAIVGNIEVKNRIVRSATHESMGNNGRVTNKLIELYKKLSDGEVGLIITGFMGFAKNDNFSPKTILINNDDFIPDLKKLTETVHNNSSKIVAQLAHVGSQLSYSPTGDVFAPSDVIDPINGITPIPFTGEQIKELVNEFGDAALRAKKAGFDGVQLHGAHGYLLSKFLSPVYNKRKDEYGGSLSNNSRIISEILKNIKSKCGYEYPVWIKLNASDFGREEDGFTYDSFLYTAKRLSKDGVDAIEVSGGTMAGKFTPCRSKKHEAYHLEYAKKLTKEIDTSIIVVGGFRKFDLIESVFEETDIDAVSLSRSLIREPGLIKRWMEGDKKDAECVACNGCFNPDGLVCFFHLEGDKRKKQKEIMKLFSPRD